jgi:hypothetical protein
MAPNPEASGEATREAGAEAHGEGRGLVASHPWLVVFSVALVVGGAVAGYLWLSPEWSALRRVAAGAVSGAGIMVLLGGPKLFVY